MHHNDAIHLVGSCPCPCHHRRDEPCWCNGSRPDTLALSHNDRIRTIGHCDCRTGACPHRHTSPEMARVVERHEERERDRRIRTGRPRAGDISHIARHPGRYPGYFG